MKLPSILFVSAIFVMGIFSGALIVQSMEQPPQANSGHGAGATSQSSLLPSEGVAFAAFFEEEKADKKQAKDMTPEEEEAEIEKHRPTMERWGKELGIKKCKGCHSSKGKGLAKYKKKTVNVGTAQHCKTQFVDKLFTKDKSGKYKKLDCKGCHKGKRFIF